MDLNYLSILTAGGLLAGIVSGLLGIGGGVILVPILIVLGFEADRAVGTSSLAVVIIAFSGSIQNWRMNKLDFKRILPLGLPALFTAQLGATLAEFFPAYILLTTFGLMLLITIYLIGVRKNLTINQVTKKEKKNRFSPSAIRIITGGLAGILAGLFGMGGGSIMVPSQVIFLGEPIKVAVQTSLGVVVINSLASTVSHFLYNNVTFNAGFLLGIGGIIGSQISTRMLPKLPDKLISFLFRSLLILLSLYVFWQAWQLYIIEN